jgi:hypothetical protein
MDVDQLGQGALGFGILAAALWNGWETYQARRLARATQAKVDETHKQVAVNGHVSETPTLLDKVDTLTHRATEAAAAARDARQASVVLGRMLEGHLDASSAEWGRMWAAIDAIRANQTRRREDYTHETSSPDPGPSSPGGGGSAEVPQRHGEPPPHACGGPQRGDAV